MTNTLADKTYVALVAYYRGAAESETRLVVLAELIRRDRGDLATHLNRERALVEQFKESDAGTPLHRRLENLRKWVDATAWHDQPTQYAHARLGRHLIHTIRTPESALTICALDVHAPATRTGSSLLCALCIPECAR